VIFHAAADNFGNVPLGAEPDKYAANSQAAIDLTNATGNAGARLACGVIG
jgi:Cu/Zn superoxide dismutase